MCFMRIAKQTIEGAELGVKKKKQLHITFQKSSLPSSLSTVFLKGGPRVTNGVGSRCYVGYVDILCHISLT